MHCDCTKTKISFFTTIAYKITLESVSTGLEREGQERRGTDSGQFKKAMTLPGKESSSLRPVLSPTILSQLYPTVPTPGTCTGTIYSKIFFYHCNVKIGSHLLSPLKQSMFPNAYSMSFINKRTIDDGNKCLKLQNQSIRSLNQGTGSFPMSKVSMLTNSVDGIVKRQQSPGRSFQEHSMDSESR